MQNHPQQEPEPRETSDEPTLTLAEKLARDGWIDKTQEFLDHGMVLMVPINEAQAKAWEEQSKPGYVHLPKKLRHAKPRREAKPEDS